MYTINLNEVSLLSEVLLFTFIGVPFGFIIWTLAVLVRSTAPDRQTREIDRAHMRFQRNFFKRKVRPTPYRTPFMQAYVTGISYWMRGTVVIGLGAWLIHILSRFLS